MFSHEIGIAQAVAAVKKKAKFPRFPEIKFKRFAEGRGRVSRPF